MEDLFDKNLFEELSDRAWEEAGAATVGDCAEEAGTGVGGANRDGAEATGAGVGGANRDVAEEAAMDPVRLEKMRASMMTRISEAEEAGRKARLHRALTWIQSAAAVILIVGALFGGYCLSSLRVKAQTFEVVAERGQKSMATLPDGSKVWLNSDSRISYSSDFNRRNRDIELEGEAYFEVARNEDIPFVVTAGEMQVTALGTKFDVKAYSTDDEIVATLVEGKIRTVAGDCSEVIRPNYKSSYSRSAGTMNVSGVAYAAHPIPWHSNELIFDGESLGEIAEVLSRMYNINVVFADDELMNYTYSGLVRNNSLENVLYLISSTSPVDSKIYNNTVKFTHK